MCCGHSFFRVPLPFDYLFLFWRALFFLAKIRVAVQEKTVPFCSFLALLGFTPRSPPSPSWFFFGHRRISASSSAKTKSKTQNCRIVAHLFSILALRSVVFSLAFFALGEIALLPPFSLLLCTVSSRGGGRFHRGSEICLLISTDNVFCGAGKEKDCA